MKFVGKHNTPNNMSKRLSSLIKNTSVLGLGTLCTKGIMFIMTPLFTRWLTQEDYGTFDLLMTYVTLIIPVASANIGESLFRYLLDSDDDKKRQSLVSTAAVFFFVTASVLFLATVIFSFVSDFSSLISSFVLYLIVELFLNFTTRLLRGLKLLDKYTIGNIIYVSMVAIFTFIMVAILSFGLPGMFIAYSIADVISIMTMLVISRSTKLFRIRSAKISVLKDMINYSLPLVPTSISWWVANVSDRTIVTIILGAEANAIYAIANKIPNLCTSLFSVFDLSWQQNASETLKDSDHDLYFTKVMNGTIVVIGSFCVLILGLNYWIIDLLFMEDYFFAYYLSPILVLAIFFSVWAQFLGGIYIAQKRSKASGVTATGAAIVNIACCLILVPHIGLFGAPLATLLSYFVLFLIRYCSVKRSVRLKISKTSLAVCALVVLFAVFSYVQSITIMKLMIIPASVVFLGFNYRAIRQSLKSAGFNKRRR